MMPTRRRLLRAGAASTFFLPRFASAAPEFEWRVGHTAPSAFPFHKRLVEAAAEIGTKSGGRIQLTVHPESQLGGQLGLMQQVRGGTVTMTPVTGQSLAGILGPIAVLSTGFAFAGYDRLWPAVDGDLGKAVRTLVRERLDVVPMARCWDFGFRQMTTRDRPIQTAADLEKLKVRVPIDPELTALFQALKAVPLGMNLQDTIPALHTRAVDAQDGLLPLVLAAKMFLDQSFCSITNHVWEGQWMCISAKAWLKLPDELKDIVAAALDLAGLRQRADNAAAEAEVRATLTRIGMTFNDVDPKSFRATLRSAGYYEKASQRAGDELWGLLEKYVGALA